MLFWPDIQTTGFYAYHSWMKDMLPIKRGSGNQHLERRSPEYRAAVDRKMGAYYRYIQLAWIAQGILQCLAIKFHKEVWAEFKRTSWLRTMKTVLSTDYQSSYPSETLKYKDESASFLAVLVNFVRRPSPFARRIHYILWFVM